MSQIPPNDPKNGSAQGLYPIVAPYVAQATAGAAGTTVMFRDMMIKPYKQKGLAVPTITYLEGMKEGLKAAPVVVAIILTQMKATEVIENTFFPDKEKRGFLSLLASAAMTGTLSSPFLAVFNGRTMGWTAMDSLRKFRVPQALAIAGQETGCVAGVYGAEPVAARAKEIFGDNVLVDCAAAAGSGAVGAIAGHAGNTALTRWQSGLKIESVPQLFWGGCSRARALATFCAIYLHGKRMLTPAKQE
jgi:hypothetical protein